MDAHRVVWSPLSVGKEVELKTLELDAKKRDLASKNSVIEEKEKEIIALKAEIARLMSLLVCVSLSYFVVLCIDAP